MADTVTAVEAVHPSTTQPRGERGRWGKRPRTVTQQSARLQAAFLHAVTEDDVEAIARKLIEQARNGDNTSARLVLKHGLGQKMGNFLADWTLECEAKEAAKAARPTSSAAQAARPTSSATAAAPTNEQVMAAIRMRMQEQEALEAEILGRVAPKPGAERRPRTAPGGTAKGTPPGRAAR